MFLSKIKDSFKKTKESLDSKISSLFNQNKNIDEIIEELEETLILSDIGATTSFKICDELRKRVKSDKDKTEENIKKLLKEEMLNILSSKDFNEVTQSEKQVILVVGVNGVGKTTSIGKLANLYKKSGKKVLLAAADTFRAGAIEQLEIWSKRSGVDIYMGNPMEDPASVVYEATKRFEAGNYDILICDTAGRLHNKKNLMDELEKIKRIIDKNLTNVKKEVLMVLDATTGQNAVLQAKNFFERTGITGMILTKLDSTAKGGVVLSIVDELKIPVKYIGVGEGIDDIQKFSNIDFIDSII